jgi:8-oxo-dGTP pyrophosphatase MutT (NUDIX family)
MKEELTRFLATGKRLCSESVEWGNGTLPLQITYYLGHEPPPLKYVSSVRAIIFRNHSTLVLRQADGHSYILPGGRVEKSEGLEEALRREILEETGWTLCRMELLGFMHLHHLGAKPQNYEYPFPDFIWPVYLAEAGDFVVNARIPDEWVYESEFKSLEEVRKVPIYKGELLLLEAAVLIRRNW